MVYLLIAAANVAAAVYGFRRATDKAAYASTWSVAITVIMVADWVVYGILHLYHYHPSLSASPLVDATLGMLLADFTYVPAMSVLLLNRFRIATAAVLLTLVFTAMESIFLRTGLFTHHGWRLWYTAALFPIYLAAIGFYFQAAHARPLPPWLTGLRKASLSYNGLALLSLVYRMTGSVYTNLHILPDYVGNQSLGRFLTYGLISAPLGWWAVAGARTVRGARLLAFTLAMYGLNWFFVAAGFQFFVAPLTAGLDALVQGALVWGACLLDDWISGLQTEGHRVAG